MLNKKTPELILVMPVYNEQASVRKVVVEWFQEIQNWTEDFSFLAVNDGSTDGTQGVLERLSQQLGNRFEIIQRENKGHGQTCLEGYKIACARGIPHVFQIDSDGQCDPQYFFRFWRDRNRFDVIYGDRFRRDDGWKRIIASKVLRIVLNLSAGVDCVDANVPYRLMKTDGLMEIVERIPCNFFLANVALAVLLKRALSWRHGYVRIRFRERYGGEPSIRVGKFADKAAELISQIKFIKSRSKTDGIR